MSDSCSSDPGPVSATLMQAFANHYRQVKQVILEMAHEHKVRNKLVAKHPKPRPQTDPLQSARVKQALAYAREQGRYQGYNEAMQREALALSLERSNQEHLFGHSSRVLLSTRGEDDDITDTPTETNPLVKPEPYEKDEMEALDEFFCRCVEDFKRRRNRPPSLVRMSPLHASMLPILMKTDIQIYIDHDIGEERMTLW